MLQRFRLKHLVSEARARARSTESIRQRIKEAGRNGQQLHIAMVSFPAAAILPGLVRDQPSRC